MSSPFQAFGALKSLARRGAESERCELCGAPVPEHHEHLVEPGERRFLCACQPCAILFSGKAGQRYRRVPISVRALPRFQMTDAQWDGLSIPIAMAFFFETSRTSRVTAVYPSPAGAVESLLPLETWQQIAEANPPVGAMEPDLEALLVNRLGPVRGFPDNQYYLLPIDECYRLIGLVRMHWRGLSGGEELWREMARYFASLAGRAEPGRETHHA